MGTDQSHRIIDETHSTVHRPVLTKDFQLVYSWDVLREHSSQRRLKFTLPDKLPDTFDTGIVASCVVLQLKSVGERLPNDDHLVNGECSGLPNLIIDRLGLLVCKFTLTRPAPTDAAVMVVLVEAPDSSDVETFHNFRDCLPTQPETVTNLVETLIAPKLIPF